MPCVRQDGVFWMRVEPVLLNVVRSMSKISLPRGTPMDPQMLLKIGKIARYVVCLPKYEHGDFD